MRVWFLPYVYLDRIRLQSQHYECHGLMTCLRDGRRWGSITDTFANKHHLVADAHDMAVKEMQERGSPANHKTPIPREYTKAQCSAGLGNQLPGLVILDTIDLRDKWDKEGYYHGTGREDLRDLEKQLGMDPGIDPEEALEVRASTREFVKNRKDKWLELKKYTTAERLHLMGWRPRHRLPERV